MKKVLILAFVAGMWLSLSGCYRGSVSDAPPYRENTRWVSKGPDIFFEVSEEFRELTGFNTYGQISIDGEIPEIVVYFDHGAGLLLMNCFRAVIGNSYLVEWAIFILINL